MRRCGVRLMPGAEPFHADGRAHADATGTAAAGRTGALLCHGFTGSPGSLRPWAEHLAAAGLTVALPRLPGHGTSWQDCNLTGWPDWYASVERALHRLTDRCDRVFVCGLSMGGCLALRLAQQHGSAVAGLVLVNPSIASSDRRLALLPLLRWILPAAGGLANDIAKAGQDEVCYDRTPLHALHSLTHAWPPVRADLPRVTQPLLVFRSVQDHVVDPSSTRLILAGVASEDVTEVVLERSYHVATLDHDAPQVFAGSLDFIRRLSPAAVHRSTPAVVRRSAPAVVGAG